MAIKTISRFHNDERGVILEWIVGLFGVFMLITAYAVYMPVGNILIKAFVENGAPLADLMFIRKMVIWSFAILGVLCMMYPFIASYRTVYDPGLQQGGGWK